MSTNNQIIQPIAVNIACGGDWVATVIIHILAVNDKAFCANSR
jgi:hypothetical protein